VVRLSLTELLNIEENSWVREDLLPILGLLTLEETYTKGKGYFVLPLSKENILLNLNRFTPYNYMNQQNLEKFEKIFKDHIELPLPKRFEYKATPTMVHPLPASKTPCKENMRGISSQYYNLTPELYNLAKITIDHHIQEIDIETYVNDLLTKIKSIGHILYVLIMLKIMEVSKDNRYYCFRVEAESLDIVGKKLYCRRSRIIPDLKEFMLQAGMDKEVVKLIDPYSEILKSYFNFNWVILNLPENPKLIAHLLSHEFNTNSCVRYLNYHVERSIAEQIYKILIKTPFMEILKSIYSDKKRIFNADIDKIPLFRPKTKGRFLKKYFNKIVHSKEDIPLNILDNEDKKALEYFKKERYLRVNLNKQLEIIPENLEDFKKIEEDIRKKDNSRINDNTKGLFLDWLKVRVDLNSDEFWERINIEKEVYITNEQIVIKKKDFMEKIDDLHSDIKEIKTDVKSIEKSVIKLSNSVEEADIRNELYNLATNNKPREFKKALKNVMEKTDWDEERKNQWAKIVLDILEKQKQLGDKKWVTFLKGLSEILIGETKTEYLTAGIGKLVEWIKK
jgi:hypothetical protein